MRDWKSLTLGEIAAYMEEDPTFALHLWTNRAKSTQLAVSTEHLASVEFQGTGTSGGPLPAVASVLLSIIERERP